jgi:hypothetical protein
LNWRESRAEGRAEQKSSDLIPVQAHDWLSRKRNPVRPPVSPVPAKPIFKEGMLEGRLDPNVQFQSPMETRSKKALEARPLPLQNSLVFMRCPTQKLTRFQKVTNEPVEDHGMITQNLSSNLSKLLLHLTPTLSTSTRHLTPHSLHKPQISSLLRRVPVLCYHHQIPLR